MFVIRSMSTTDARPGVDPVPYHIFLLSAGKRASGWWAATTVDAEKFETEAEALSAVAAMQIDGAQVVPIGADALGLPPYWEWRKERSAVLA